MNCVVNLTLILIILTLCVNKCSSYVSQCLIGNTVISCNHDRTLNLDVTRTKVYFYDYSNNYKKCYTIATAAYNINRYITPRNIQRMHVYVPGFDPLVADQTTSNITKAFSGKTDTYLITIDYSMYIGEYSDETLQSSVPYAYYVGRAVARLLAQLNIRERNLHVIGHSFGANIIGNIGRCYMDIKNKYIHRLTGIDPQSCCFQNTPLEYQLSSDKGRYVETIHCTSTIGASNVISDVDFYYNKELSNQPGCDGYSDTELCSTTICAQLYANTITDRSSYKACGSYEEYLNGVCYSQVTTAGFYNDDKAAIKGIFYASTNSTFDDEYTKLNTDYYLSNGVVYAED